MFFSSYLSGIGHFFNVICNVMFTQNRSYHTYYSDVYPLDARGYTIQASIYLVLTIHQLFQYVAQSFLCNIPSAFRDIMCTPQWVGLTPN